MDRKITSIVIIVVAILLILSIPFIPKELIDQYGLIVFLVPIAILIIVLFVAVMIVNKKDHVNLLEDDRHKLIVELKEAEKQYLQHKIDKSTFDAISKKNNSALIKLESDIDFQKNKQLSKADMKKADALSSDKRKILFDLLEQKQKKVHELKIAEGSYLKRKIDEETYKKISSDIKTELISIDAQVRALQETAEIDKIKDQLKESAKEIVKQKKSSDARNVLDYMDEMEEEVFEQTVGKSD
jgi:cell division protein FtsL